jgi:hypothetical protein
MLRKTLLVTTALVLGASVSYAGIKGNDPGAKIHPKFLSLGQPGHMVHGNPVNVANGNTKNLPPVHNSKVLPSGGLWSNLSKSPNALWISWYGFTAENSAYSYYASKDYHYNYDDVASNAVPFSTSGGKAKSAEFGGFMYASTAEVEAQILSSTGSGLPGNPVATTASTTMSDSSLCCSDGRTVKFPKGTSIAAGNYFATVNCVNSPCYGGWAMEDVDFSGATVDYFHYKDHETYNFGTSCPSGTFCHNHTFNSSSPWHKSTFYPTAGAMLIK